MSATISNVGRRIIVVICVLIGVPPVAHLRRFSDVTDTRLAGSNVSLARWIYLLRELDKDRSVNAIYSEIDVTYKTALRMAHLIRDYVYLQRDTWRTSLTDDVEGDDTSQAR